MTVTSNIHIGLSAWANQTYALFNRVSTGGNAYQCIVPGSSTSAPTGTGSAINNGGTAVWKWLSAIDYTTFQGFADGIENPRTTDHDAIVWNDGLIQCVTGTQLLYLADLSTGSFKTTIRVAPGDGLRDTTGPLAYDASRGLAIQLPTGSDTDIAYIWIESPNVTLEGFQFKNPREGGLSTPIGATTSASNLTIRKCLFDVKGRSSVKNLECGGPNPLVVNCVFIDSHSTAPQNLLGLTAGAGAIVNCVFVATAAAGVAQAIFVEDTLNSGRYIRNSAIFGWSGAEPIWADASNIITADHCITDSSNMGDITIDGGSNLVSKVASSQFVSATTDFRLKLTADAHQTAVTDTTDIPASDDFYGTPRGASLWDMGPFQINLSPPAHGVLVGRQQEVSLLGQRHPLSLLRSNFISGPVNAPVVTRSIVTRQEQPRHPLPQMLPGRQGPNVRSPVVDRIQVRQEQPGHPSSVLRPSLQIRNVREPTTNTVLTRQELPSHPLPQVRQNLYGQSVRSPVADTILGRQELPSHPLPRVVSGVQGPDVRAPVADTVLGRQEQPRHAPSVLLQQVYGLNVRSPTVDTLLLRQEQPGHPLPTLRPSLQIRNVATPGETGQVLVRQQQPDHPLPRFDAGVYTNRPPQAPYPIGDFFTGRQEYPRHPGPSLVSGIQGPNVRAIAADTILVRQQQPDHLQPLLQHRIFGLNVREPTTSTVLVRQEPPWHPAPFLGASPQITNVRVCVTDTILGRQEQPSHPLPRLSASIQGPNVHTKITDLVMGRQQQPGHPSPILLPGVQGPNVYTKITDSLATRQELPGHPLPVVRAGVQGPNVAPPYMIGGVVVRQQQPDHPLPFTRIGLTPSTFLPPTLRHVFVRQEWPWHPSSRLEPGQSININRPFVIGRTVQLRADL